MDGTDSSCASMSATACPSASRCARALKSCAPLTPAPWRGSPPPCRSPPRPSRAVYPAPGSRCALTLRLWLAAHPSQSSRGPESAEAPRQRAGAERDVLDGARRARCGPSLRRGPMPRTPRRPALRFRRGPPPEPQIVARLRPEGARAPYSTKPMSRAVIRGRVHPERSPLPQQRATRRALRTHRTRSSVAVVRTDGNPCVARDPGGQRRASIAPASAACAVWTLALFGPGRVRVLRFGCGAIRVACRTTVVHSASVHPMRWLLDPALHA